MEILQEAVRTAGLSILGAHRELGARWPFGGNFLPAQVQDAVLIQQQLVQEHQFFLGIDRKPGTAPTAFDHDQFLEVAFAFRITPQSGDSFHHPRKGFDCRGLTGALALEHLAFAEKLLRQRGVDDSIIYCHYYRYVVSSCFIKLI